MMDATILKHLPDLAAAALELVRQIPWGSVSTYGDLARALGDERARSARWLGELLQHHEHSPDCPCHRVVRSNGEIGLYFSGDPQTKATLLRGEGVRVSDGGIVDVSQRFTSYCSDRPLERLRLWQQGLTAQVRLEPLDGLPRTIGAVDVAYGPDGLAHAAYVQLEFPSLRILHQLTCRRAVEFPYLPGYLTFRELPAMLPLCREAAGQGILADVLFVDGNGALHPWRAGIATCLGVLLDHPVIGVGKSLLCGRVDLTGMTAADERPVIDGDDVIGVALKAGDHSRPVFVSIGNRITLPEAVAISRSCLRGHRLPEPIHLADRLTKRMK